MPLKKGPKANLVKGFATTTNQIPTYAPVEQGGFVNPFDPFGENVFVDDAKKKKKKKKKKRRTAPSGY